MDIQCLHTFTFHIYLYICKFVSQSNTSYIRGFPFQLLTPCSHSFMPSSTHYTNASRIRTRKYLQIHTHVDVYTQLRVHFQIKIHFSYIINSIYTYLFSACIMTQIPSLSPHSQVSSPPCCSWSASFSFTFIYVYKYTFTYTNTYTYEILYIHIHTRGCTYLYIHTLTKTGY